MVHISFASSPVPLIVFAALPALSVPIIQLKGLSARTIIDPALEQRQVGGNTALKDIFGRDISDNEFTAREPNIFGKGIHKLVGREISDEILARQLELADLDERDVAQIFSKFMGKLGPRDVAQKFSKFMAKLGPRDGHELEERDVAQIFSKFMAKLGPRDVPELEERDVAQIFSKFMAKLGPRDGHELEERDVAQIFSKFMAKLGPRDVPRLEERDVAQIFSKFMAKLGPRDVPELEERDVAQIFNKFMAKLGPRDGANGVVSREPELAAREPFIIGAAFRAVRHVLAGRALNLNNDVLAERYIGDLD
ncbi:hypothetical protein B0H34DRAFT_800647 [Crassisporium funariophilum]|nr:hypothetical protein B0H34DRAFT_800647 [Crassisporium funariophilum]